MQDFKGRVAVVTGGGSGIGLGMCRAFAARGMKLVIADVDDDSVWLRELGICADDAQFAVVQFVIGQLATRFDQVDRRRASTVEGFAHGCSHASWLPACTRRNDNILELDKLSNTNTSNPSAMSSTKVWVPI